jgi:hypothetical protein
MARVIAEERKRMRNYVAEQLKQLRAEFSIAKAHDDGQVIDMPSPLIRKVRNAA